MIDRVENLMFFFGFYINLDMYILLKYVFLFIRIIYGKFLYIKLYLSFIDFDFICNE